ncbi:LytR C-terminal domain-containing protein [Nocardia caishijiensis]|uniref:LytR cell envelope-related transcriptional attenuator n=1 Tax=Nocardia caishijiensis TaxID=184756 RepID=A0ABQ6YUJ8_9NOCA|nr:LytR C-terminal domain-containing protein [Nocardia caishijiensis]KAF0849106.1 LytR cell envelope-related transcriptional attenuator [Nocardia caishijiensis]
MSNPNPTPGGPPLRALAMVLIALAIVFAGLGAMSLSNSGAEAADPVEQTETTTSSAVAQAPATTAAPTTTSAAAAPTTTTTVAPTTTTTTTNPPAAASGDKAIPVRVLNNSLVAGLAARTASELGAAGWTNVSTGNYSGANLTATTVYYGSGPGEEAAAAEIAAQVGGTVAPKTGDSTPGVVVVLTGR